MAGVARVRQVIEQAKTTFKKAKGDATFQEDFERLKSLMNQLKAEDFDISPKIADRRWDYPPHVLDSPASCMEVYECPDFSVGIFFLKPRKSMPLHDHPGMHGAMKILFGSMTVTSFSKPENHTLLRPPFVCKFVSTVRLTSSSEPCTLYPESGNIHEIKANDEAVAFLDILAPPYNPNEDRDCTYYTRKTTEPSPDKSELLSPGRNPSWFSCVPMTYRGPKIS